MKKKLETSVLVKQYTDGCAGFKDKEFHVNIEVPSTPPTDVLLSKIIKVRYWIRVRIFFPLFHLNFQRIYLNLFVDNWFCTTMAL